jgi:putative nucleotidyltransferase with HDIG domain
MSLLERSAAQSTGEAEEGSFMISLDDQRDAQPVKDVPGMPPWALDRLPPLPMVAVRLIQLFANPDVHITEIGRIIAVEPVFAARVLQMANSPLFAARSQVTSISHAIVLLGLNRVKAITITRAMGDYVAPVMKIEGLKPCWRNSLATAILSEKLARACKMDPDLAYVAGLLRDIGRLALLVKYPDAYANLLAVSEENSFDLLAVEHDLFEMNHCQAGTWILEQSPFPAELREVVAWHHEALSENPFRMVSLVHVADLMADTLGFPVIEHTARQSYECLLESLPEGAQSRFPQDAEALAEEIAARLQSWM